METNDSEKVMSVEQARLVLARMIQKNPLPSVVLIVFAALFFGAWIAPAAFAEMTKFVNAWPVTLAVVALVFKGENVVIRFSSRDGAVFEVSASREQAGPKARK